MAVGGFCDFTGRGPPPCRYFFRRAGPSKKAALVGPTPWGSFGGSGIDLWGPRLNLGSAGLNFSAVGSASEGLGCESVAEPGFWLSCGALVLGALKKWGAYGRGGASKILPGFSRPRGSSACLRARSSCSSWGVRLKCRASFFSRPMPCSAETEPRWAWTS